MTRDLKQLSERILKEAAEHGRIATTNPDKTIGGRYNSVADVPPSEDSDFSRLPLADQRLIDKTVDAAIRNENATGRMSSIADPNSDSARTWVEIRVQAERAVLADTQNLANLKKIEASRSVVQPSNAR